MKLRLALVAGALFFVGICMAIEQPPWNEHMATAQELQAYKRLRLYYSDIRQLRKELDEPWLSEAPEEKELMEKRLRDLKEECRQLHAQYPRIKMPTMFQ